MKKIKFSIVYILSFVILAVFRSTAGNIETHKFVVYISRKDGIFIKHRNGILKNISLGIGRKRIGGNLVYPIITSFDYKEGKFLSSTFDKVYIKEDVEKAWIPLSQKGIFPKSTIISTRFFGADIVIGTASKGIYISYNKRFTSINYNLPYLSSFRGEKIYPPIENIMIDGKDLYIYTRDKIYHLLENKKWSEIPISPLLLRKKFKPDSIFIIKGKIGYSVNGNIFYNSKITPQKIDFPQKKTYTNIIFDDKIKIFFHNEDNKYLIQKPRIAILDKDIRGIFVRTPYLFKRNKMAELLEYIEDNRINTLVVDIKDENGIIYIDTRDKFFKKRTFHLSNKLRKRLCELKDSGLFIIGRIVCFKDPFLSKYKNYKYAIYDAVKNIPWQNNSGKTWADPYSFFIKKRIIELSKYAERYPFDMLQYDYIRFPTDGNILTIRYRHNKYGLSKIEAIEDFLVYANKELKLPISADIYGYNTFINGGRGIGQNIGLISYYTDALMPMLYTDLFSENFMKGKNRNSKIIKQSLKNSKRYVRNGISIIPFIKAYKTNKKELMSELEAVAKSRVQGYIMWHSNASYSIGLN